MIINSGLKDKNNREILDGHTIKATGIKDNLGREYKISFEKGCFTAKCYKSETCLGNLNLSDFEILD
jgi:hypothetical protein